jgi:hypothetical protein
MKRILKNDPIWQVSNPTIVQKKAYENYGRDAIIYRSEAKNKKYSIRNPQGRLINFGNIEYEDYTKHRNDERRQRYLKRSAGIKGNWKDDKYSPNNLSRLLLW